MKMSELKGCPDWTAPAAHELRAYAVELGECARAKRLDEIADLIEASRAAEEALKPFARLAGPINGEEGRISYIEAIDTAYGGSGELRLSSHTHATNRYEILWAADFERAASLTIAPDAMLAEARQRFPWVFSRTPKPVELHPSVWNTRAAETELREALKEAVRTIRTFHRIVQPDADEETLWRLYLTSPEMRKITAALSNSGASTDV